MREETTREVYVSVDIETTGPIPGKYSMISIGAVAYDSRTLKEVGSFYDHLNELGGAGRDADTMVWWAQHQEAWDKQRLNPELPQRVMENFEKWLKSLEARPIFVAWPAGFDFTFTHWYFHAFLGKDPFGFSALDMKTMAWTLLGGSYNGCWERAQQLWDPEYMIPMNHIAVNDARRQGVMFCNMMAFAQSARNSKEEA